MRPTRFLTISLLTLAAAYTTGASAASADEAGYYGAARVVFAEHKAHNMASSARPGIGGFVPGQQTDKFTTGAFALGYEFGNGWRAEGEYTLPKEDTFTSGSTAFPTSFNTNYIKSQRLMANVYRDFPIIDRVSVYGMAGLGISHVRSSGWQGNASRQYVAAIQNNLTWSLGAGVTYAPIERLTLDLGYRYVDSGKSQSGWNAFGNARGLQDEMMRADVTSSEVYLGARYRF